MGKVKEYWMEQQELQPMYDWIDDHYGEDAPLEGTDAWDLAVEEYHQYGSGVEAQAAYEYAADEYSYYIHLTLGETDSKFERDHAELLAFVKRFSKQENTLLYRMCLAQAVTIFEVYMEEITKTLLTHNAEFLESYLRNSKAITEKRFSLKDLRFGMKDIQDKLSDEVLKTLAISKQSGVLYHKVDQVLSTFESMLGRSMKVDLKSIKKTIAIRHDVVHRNGVNKSGKQLSIGRDEAIEALEAVYKTARVIRSEIDHLPQ